MFFNASASTETISSDSLTSRYVSAPYGPLGGAIDALLVGVGGVATRGVGDAVPRPLVCRADALGPDHFDSVSPCAPPPLLVSGRVLAAYCRSARSLAIWISSSV